MDVIGLGWLPSSYATRMVGDLTAPPPVPPLSLNTTHAMPPRLTVRAPRQDGAAIQRDRQLDW